MKKDRNEGNEKNIIKKYIRSKQDEQFFMKKYIEFYVVNIFLIQISEGSLCQLHTGEAGICKNSKNCKWLIQNFQRKKMQFEDIRRCSFAVNEEIVCCGDDHPTSTDPQISSPCELGYLFE